MSKAPLYRQKLLGIKLSATVTGANLSARYPCTCKARCAPLHVTPDVSLHSLQTKAICPLAFSSGGRLPVSSRDPDPALQPRARRRAVGPAWPFRFSQHGGALAFSSGGRRESWAGTNPGTGTGYHPTALPTVGPYAFSSGGRRESWSRSSHAALLAPCRERE